MVCVCVQRRRPGSEGFLNANNTAGGPETSNLGTRFSRKEAILKIAITKSVYGLGGSCHGNMEPMEFGWSFVTGTKLPK